MKTKRHLRQWTETSPSCPYEPGYVANKQADKRRKETKERLRQRERELPNANSRRQSCRSGLELPQWAASSLSSFLGIYTSKGILPADPFVSIDRAWGELVRIATKRGRKVRPKLKLGICGEHGGDPASVSFCHEVGLDYVSCSPFRLPIARLAAAQAALGKRVGSEG